jgi:hypothetical protein
MLQLGSTAWLAVLAAHPVHGQESLCDPCVDPSMNRQPAVPEDVPLVSPSGSFNLGASIARLRGLGAESGSRTLTLVDSRRAGVEGGYDVAAGELSGDDVTDAGAANGGGTGRDRAVSAAEQTAEP